MSTNKTTNHVMNSWVAGDYHKRTELNENFDIIDAALGKFADLTTTEKSNLVGAINEIFTTLALSNGIGGAAIVGSPLIDGSASTNVSGQIAALRQMIQDIAGGGVPLGTVNNGMLANDIKVGSLAALLTNIKTSVVGAINELQGKATPYAIATNVDNTYSVSYTPAFTAYVEGMPISFKASANSTGACAVNVDGLGVVAIVKADGSAVTNIKDEGIYTLRYNGVNFQLQGEGGSGNAIASDLRSGKTANTDAGEIIGTMDLSNKLAGNIKLGITIDGTTGTYDAKRYASGNGTTASSGGRLTVNTLTFTPTLIILQLRSGTNYYRMIYHPSSAFSATQYYADEGWVASSADSKYYGGDTSYVSNGWGFGNGTPSNTLNWTTSSTGFITCNTGWSSTSVYWWAIE